MHDIGNIDPMWYFMYPAGIFRLDRFGNRVSFYFGTCRVKWGFFRRRRIQVACCLAILEICESVSKHDWCSSKYQTESQWGTTKNGGISERRCFCAWQDGPSRSGGAPTASRLRGEEARSWLFQWCFNLYREKITKAYKSIEIHLTKPFSGWYHKIGLSKRTTGWLTSNQLTLPGFSKARLAPSRKQTGLHWVTGLPKSIKKPCRRMSFSLELVARLAQSSWSQCDIAVHMYIYTVYRIL